MGALARALDWSRTAVGPVETWPQSLRTALSILLESKFPMLLCWGPDFVQFYNDPFRPILGASKHPALGKSTRETFAEAWHIIGPLFEQVMQGSAVGFEDIIAVFRGPDHVFELANDLYYQIVGRRDLLGDPSARRCRNWVPRASGRSSIASTRAASPTWRTSSARNSIGAATARSTKGSSTSSSSRSRTRTGRRKAS